MDKKREKKARTVKGRMKLKVEDKVKKRVALIIPEKINIILKDPSDDDESEEDKTGG